MDPNGGANQHNQQVNQNYGKGPLYANQGRQEINNTYTTPAAKSWAGWTIVVLLILDVGFFFYGKASYTGVAGDSGDLWRAGIYFVLLVATVRMIRTWVRSKR
ncbi:MAG: hypothetical protein ABIQ18_05230 [Umezawaea sp.]